MLIGFLLFVFSYVESLHFQIVMKLKISNCDKNQFVIKLKLLTAQLVRKIQIVTKLNNLKNDNLYCDKT